MILASRTIQSTLESGARAGYDGAKRRKGAKVHAAVDSLGHLLAWTNPNICVKGFGADLSTAEGVACDERPTRWASRVHVTPGR
jgi:hypothetical protein